MTVQIDLSPSFSPIRDQGQRPTCLAFAASSAHELALGRTEPLSVEALFFHCKRRDGLSAARGTTVAATADVLGTLGQCAEVLWPYGESEPALFPSDYFRARIEERARLGLLDLVKQALKAARAPVLVVYLTNAWFSVKPDGLITPPAPNDQREGAHAVTVIGYDDATATVLIRNSWGKDWGSGGYAQLPFSQVESNGIEVFTLGAASTP